MRGWKTLLTAILLTWGAAGRLRADPPPTVLPLDHCLVEPIDESQVPAQEAGVLVALKVHEGQVVAKGDLLAQMDDSQPQLERLKAESELSAARIKAENDIDVRYARAASKVAQAEYEKSMEANRSADRAVTQVDLDRLRLTWQRADLQIEQSQLEQLIAKQEVASKAADVEAAKQAILRRQIRAPIDGIVMHVNQHLGEWVKPGDTVLRIVQVNRLFVKGFLNASQVAPGSVRGRPVTVTVDLVDHPEPVRGRIVFVGSPELEAGGQYRFTAEINNRLVPGTDDDWQISAGATATIQIELK